MPDQLPEGVDWKRLGEILADPNCDGRRFVEESDLDAIRHQERERIGSEERRLAAFEALTEGNFFSFTDPEHQEEYVWQIVDAVMNAALDSTQPDTGEGRT